MLKYCVRYTLIEIRMLEQLARFPEIPKVALKMTNVENSVPFLGPLPFEKASYNYLLSEDGLHHKKFCFYQFLAALTYYNQGSDFKKFTLNSFYMISMFFNKTDSSFLKVKEHLYSNIGEIAMRLNKHENSAKFYSNCILLSLNKQNNEEHQALYIRSFLKSVRENETLKKDNTLSDGEVVFSTKYLVKDIRIPEVINSSLISFEEQDVNLTKFKGWKIFKQFLKLDKGYINLSDSDYIVLKNLDYLADNKLFTNEKRKFKSIVNKKIFIKMVIKNPLNISLTISSMKLLTQYINSPNLNEDVEVEDVNITFKPKSSNTISLYVIPKKPGMLNVVGLEICLFGIASFKNFFMDLDYREENFLYEEKIPPKDGYNLLKYNILEEDNDMLVEFLDSDPMLFQYQFSSVKVRILNRSNNSVIKKFSFLFENNDIFISNFLHFDVTLKKNEQTIIDLPMCPQVHGRFYQKILIKFEEESKFKEIEVKRFLLPTTVLPIIYSNITESLIYSDDKVLSIRLNTKFNFNTTPHTVPNSEIETKNYYQASAVENCETALSKYFLKTESFDEYLDNKDTAKSSNLHKLERVTYAEQNQIFYYSNFLVDKPNEISTKSELKNSLNKGKNDKESEQQFYSKMNYNSSYNDANSSFILKYIDFDEQTIKKLFNSTGKSFRSLEEIPSSTNTEESNEKKYTNKEINKVSKFNESLIIRFSKNTVLITFDVKLNFQSGSSSAVDEPFSEGRKIDVIKCGIFYEVKINSEVSNTEFLMNCIKNSLSVKIEPEILDESSTLIKVNLNVKPMFKSLGLKEYAFSTISDSDITWIGTKTKNFRSKNSKEDNNSTDNYKEIESNEVKFACITKLRNKINLNKISLSLLSNHIGDKPIVFDYLPIPLTLDLD